MFIFETLSWQPGRASDDALCLLILVSLTSTALSITESTIALK